LRLQIFPASLQGSPFMPAPFFYIAQFDPSKKVISLDEDTSKHIARVLRMQEGEKINITDGKGNLVTCAVLETHKKHCKAEVKETAIRKPATPDITVAISLLKNTNRFEWFLEKATEIGVSEIIPLICVRTEKEKFRFERLNAICISAMLQSQQCRLPVLHEPLLFNKAITAIQCDQKFIAHCAEGKKKQLGQRSVNGSAAILIGPEGDFTEREIQLALENNFIPVSLGETRLRTETAGVVAAIKLMN